MLSVRYTYDTPFQLTPRVSPQNTRTFDVKTHKGVVSYIHTASSWSAETRVGYNRFERVRLDEIFNLGVSAITGSLGFSNSGELMENLGVTYSVDEIVAVTRGRHSIKLGGLFQMWKSGRNNETVPEFQFARWTNRASGPSPRARCRREPMKPGWVAMIRAFSRYTSMKCSASAAGTA